VSHGLEDGPAKQCHNSFGGICLYICNTITFESLYLESSFFGMQVNLRGHRWNSYMKVIWSKSRWKVFRIGTVRYNWPMSAHASQAFSIAHCTDSEDLPSRSQNAIILHDISILSTVVAYPDK